MVYVHVTGKEIDLGWNAVRDLVATRYFDGTRHSWYSYDLWEKDFGFSYRDDVYPVTGCFLNLLPRRENIVRASTASTDRAVVNLGTPSIFDYAVDVAADPEQLHAIVKCNVAAFQDQDVVGFTENWLQYALGKFEIGINSQNEQVKGN